MIRVYIFTSKGCPFCDQLKRMLVMEKISFFDWDVQEHEIDYLPIIEQSGSDLVPAVMFIDGNNKEKTYLIPEKDFFSLDECVSLVKQKLYIS